MSRKKYIEHVHRIGQFLERDITKLVLSILIIVSLLPSEFVESLSLIFFCIFAFEFLIRTVNFVPAYKEGMTGRIELLFLCFDFIATISFLPLDRIFPSIADARLLRLFRLSRMFLLFGYWGSIARDVWIIIVKRKYQLLFVGTMVVILSFVSAVFLQHFSEIDFNNDDVVDERDKSFITILWWSFRQLEDPGNLMESVEGGAAFILSFFLTIGGVFIVSFLIGIGTNVVEELVKVSRERRIGMDKHSVLINISAFSNILLNELNEYYLKHLRRPNIAVLGKSESKPEFLYAPELRRVRYRRGNPTHANDLIKVDTDRATRAIILRNDKYEDSDSHVISQIISVRELNPDCRIFAEILRDQNVEIAIEAGKHNVVAFPAGRITSLILTNLVLFPGMESVFSELLTHQGHEIYTCICGMGQMASVSPETLTFDGTFQDLMIYAYKHHGINLLGTIKKRPAHSNAQLTKNEYVLIPADEELCLKETCGFIAVAANFEEIKDFCTAVKRREIPTLKAKNTAPAGIPSFKLCEESFGIDRILICNFRESLVTFVEQLILFQQSNDIQLSIMVPEQEQLEETLQYFIRYSRRSHVHDKQQVVFEQQGPDRLSYVRNGSRGVHAINILTGDYSDELELIDPSGKPFSIKDMDAIVFTIDQENKTDPDARTVLSALNLLKLRREQPELFKSSIRIIAEINDPDKAELLEKRATEHSPEKGLHKVITVFSLQTVQNNFLAQVVFVPGIIPIYTELLSESGMEICRLLPSWSTENRDHEIMFPDLLHSLYERDNIILVGIELMPGNGNGHRLYINPMPGDEGYAFRLGDLIGICVIANTGALPFREPCDTASGT